MVDSRNIWKEFRWFQKLAKICLLWVRFSSFFTFLLFSLRIEIWQIRFSFWLLYNYHWSSLVLLRDSSKSGTRTQTPLSLFSKTKTDRLLFFILRRFSFVHQQSNRELQIFLMMILRVYYIKEKYFSVKCFLCW